MAAADFFGNLGTSVIGGALNSIFGGLMADHNARINYRYNEMAAEQADRRQRALYEDYMTPSARMQLLKQAGLSPALYAEGAGGGNSGMTMGAQGSGASGVSIPANMVDPVSLADIKLKEAQANNLNADTGIKNLENEIKEMQKNLTTIDYSIATTFVKTANGDKSFYEFAQDFEDFDKYIEALRESGERAHDHKMLYITNSTKGIEALKTIFLMRKQLNTEISTLSATKENADFQKSIVQAMSKTEFTDLNAQAAVAYLKANIQTQQLTEEQKGAWNRVIEHIGEKSETMRDIIVILAMIINNAAATWHMPSIVNRSYETNNNINT